MKKRAFEKLLREAIILEAEEQGARLAGVPTEPVPADAQARFNASLKTERQTAARETTPEIPVKQESRARRIARGWMTAGIAVVTTAALIFVIGLMAAGGMSRGTKAADALPAEQQPPEWSAEHPAEQEPKMPDEVQPEAPTEEPKETSAPAPGGMPLAPVEELPEVKTVVYPWQGYSCLIPEGFVSAHESDQEFISVTSEMNDRNMFQMAYELVPTETLEGWDSDVFSEQHLKILLSKIGVPESQYADFVGHSMRTVENGVVCYHLYNRSQKVYACLARVLSDEKNSLIAVGMTLGEYGVGEFDSVVNALAQRYTEAIPEDPEQPELQLKKQEWQGYSCLFPETFEIQAIRDQKLSATEKALLKLDMDALQTVGLTDMDYYLVAESMLNGKDLLTWYLTADGWDDKPEDFDTAESVKIVPGIVSVHYYNRNYDSYICIAKLNTIGTNILFLSASSLTKDGTADFDSIVKQFVKINGDFAPSDNDILNGKYGISKVFSGDGYQITLTEQFSEQKSEMGFNGYYTSYFGAVMIKIEPFTLKAGLADKTLTEYIQDVIRNNNSDAQPEERDGLIFYRYRRSGMCGWNFAFKGDTAFYLVQFMCREADESELTDLFFAFAKSMTINQSSEKETSQTVFEAEALTEDHPAVASLAKASEENALICADLCAQLLVLHESEALPFGLDFILQEISRVAEKDDRVYYNMVIQSGADAYSVQWLSDAGEQHAILASIYAISSDGEHCIFYTGEHTALLYHVYSEWDEEAIRAECVDKVAAACRIDRWKAESVLKQLDLLCDSLSKDDDLFMYNPMESVICVQETEHTCLIRIVPIFSDQEDAFFMVHTEGIVPVIEQYDVKGTVPLTTADRQKCQENRPSDILALGALILNRKTKW